MKIGLTLRNILVITSVIFLYSGSVQAEQLPTLSIKGRVLSPDGTGVSGATVNLYYMFARTPTSTITTDSLGQYEIATVRGIMYLDVKADGLLFHPARLVAFTDREVNFEGSAAHRISKRNTVTYGLRSVPRDQCSLSELDLTEDMRKYNSYAGSNCKQDFYANGHTDLDSVRVEYNEFGCVLTFENVCEKYQNIRPINKSERRVQKAIVN